MFWGNAGEKRGDFISLSSLSPTCPCPWLVHLLEFIVLATLAPWVIIRMTALDGMVEGRGAISPVLSLPAQRRSSYTSPLSPHA